MNQSRMHHRTKEILLVVCIILALTAVLVLVSVIPLDSETIIALIWLLIIPLSYEILSEQEVQGLLDLPGIPAGSTWQPRPPRQRAVASLSAKEQAIRRMRLALQRHGYSSNPPTNDLELDLIAKSAEGRNLIVKVAEGQAGILVCQDAMKAMLSTGASEAIVLAPSGSTSAARRFVKKVRSRRGMRIRIWNDPDEAETRIKKASDSGERE